MIDAAKLARLRPLMPVQALIDLAGQAWRPPGDKDLGFANLRGIEGFGARIDVSGRLGSVTFFGEHFESLSIEGLHIGMALAEARQLYPSMAQDDGESIHGIEPYRAGTSDGHTIHMRFKDGRLFAFDLVNPAATYLEPAPPRTWPRTARAYDIALLPRRADRKAPDNHGWCFGLPPGISPEQWPLDPRTGHPMRHAFTLLLPPDHRVKGPGLVAFSLFGTDWAGDGTGQNDEVEDAWDDPEPPDDPDLLPIWQHRTGRHRHEYRMTDGLDEPYAVLWLTEAEFTGPLCRPPLHPDNDVLGDCPLPAWTRVGAAAAMVDSVVSPYLDLPAEQYYVVRSIGGMPERHLAYDVALRWTERQDDPNAGLTPPEGWTESTPQGYVPIHDEDGTREPWAETHARNHIGGTMDPVQSHPDPGFSPFYVEFEELFGGFNFGSDGIAQLDLDQMRLDWACG